MFRIRFHGRGGQGMKTASRMLGTALFLEGYEVQDAPRYGAERRGAPIFAFVRADRRPIQERGVIPDPDLVVVADDSLLGVPAAGVLPGVTARTVLLVSTDESAETWRARLHLSGPILTLPAEGGSEDRAELPYSGAACAGAAARLLGVVSREHLEEAVREEVGGLGAAVVAKNLERALGAFDALAPHAGCVQEGALAAPAARPHWIDLAFDPAPRASPNIHAEATSLRTPTGLWRTLRPVLERERCNRCVWVCGTFCPDNAIHVDAEGYPDIDYDHCKGCLVCVVQCPRHAIEAVPEQLAAAAEEATP